jgi:hypothetical protein
MKYVVQPAEFSRALKSMISSAVNGDVFLVPYAMQVHVFDELKSNICPDKKISVQLLNAKN